MFFTGLEPENGFRCALPCENMENATFSQISSLNINESYLFPPDPDDEDKFDYCKPFKYNGPLDGSSSCLDVTFDQNNSIDFKCDHDR